MQAKSALNNIPLKFNYTIGKLNPHVNYLVSIIHMKKVHLFEVH